MPEIPETRVAIFKEGTLTWSVSEDGNSRMHFQLDGETIDDEQGEALLIANDYTD